MRGTIPKDGSVRTIAVLRVDKHEMADYFNSLMGWCPDVGEELGKIGSYTRKAVGDDVVRARGLYNTFKTLEGRNEINADVVGDYVNLFIKEIMEV